jgi:hypothetical protein
MGLIEIGTDGAKWIRLAHDRVQWLVFEHSTEPAGSIKKADYCLTSWVTNNFPKNILHSGVSTHSEITNNFVQHTSPSSLYRLFQTACTHFFSPIGWLFCTNNTSVNDRYQFPSYYSLMSALTIYKGLTTMKPLNLHSNFFPPEIN